MVQQLEIHFVTRSGFLDYEWFTALSDEEIMQYIRFKKGKGVVLPNDEPYMLAAIVSNTDQNLELDIYPAVMELRRFIEKSKLYEDEETSKEIKVLFVGWNPSNVEKEVTISLLENLIGMGFIFKLST